MATRVTPFDTLRELDAKKSIHDCIDYKGWMPVVIGLFSVGDQLLVQTDVKGELILPSRRLTSSNTRLADAFKLDERFYRILHDPRYTGLAQYNMYPDDNVRREFQMGTLTFLVDGVLTQMPPMHEGRRMHYELLDTEVAVQRLDANFDKFHDIRTATALAAIEAYAADAA